MVLVVEEILGFTALLPMVDPFGNMSIFAALTEGMPPVALRRIVAKSIVVATVVLLLFGFLGNRLFDLFGITTAGLKVVGGIIFFMMGYDMLQARLSRTKVSNPPTPEEKEVIDDIAVTPLGIPLIWGPGAMTFAVLQMEKATTGPKKIGFVVGTLAMMAFTAACLVGATRIAKLIGNSGSKVILRLMGLLLMVISIESFFSGLTPLVRAMLNIQ